MKLTRLLLLSLLLCTGCRKYADNPSLSHPAYIRVFNDIPDTQTPYNIGGVQAFFAFLLDPVTDGNGTVTNAAVVGDFLANRQVFSLSYSVNENTSSLAGNAAYPRNYDYPGNEHVLTAPSMNGFNLSAWAQVPSGKHRVVMLTRPTTATAVLQLPEKAREKSNIVIDTTLDLTSGEVYTLEAVVRDLLTNRYGLYVRKEDFIHRNFYSDKLYAAFYNLSGTSEAAVNPGFIPPSDDTVSISYTYSTFLYTGYFNGGVTGNFVPLTGYNNQYFTTLYSFADTTPYLELPVLPGSAFFDPQGFLGAYGSNVTNNYLTGTLPRFQFTANANRADCILNPDSANLSLGVIGVNLLANVYPITTVNNKITIGSAVNYFEYVNGTVYMMQLQRVAGNPYNN